MSSKIIDLSRVKPSGSQDSVTEEDTLRYPANQSGSTPPKVETLVDQQRQIIRSFRQAAARRTRAEAEVETRRKVEQEGAEANLIHSRKSADDQLSAITKAQEESSTALASAGLKNVMEQTTNALLTPPPVATQVWDSPRR